MSIWKKKQIVLGIFFLIFFFLGGAYKSESVNLVGRGRECVWGALCLKFSINKNIMLEKNSGKGIAAILNNYSVETKHMLQL